MDRVVYQRGYYLHLDTGRLVVSSGCDRSVFSQGGGLEHEFENALTVGV